jgi:thiamine-monophosphate kinase
VVVSGQPGLAALALQQTLGGREINPEASRALIRPQPRLALGQLLPGLASACIDVSDGLAADLGHILRASGCGAELSLENLPRPAALADLLPAERWALQLTGGDDYELCFTVPEHQLKSLAELEMKTGVALHVIGRIVKASGLKLLLSDGQEFQLKQSGYEHFSEQLPKQNSGLPHEP